MNVFGDYARYYDLLYREKDYAAEAAYVLSLVRKSVPHARSILELGCGTGMHAQHLAGSGVFVHGVDCSASMLEQAQVRQQSVSAEIRQRLAFSQGDIRHLQLDKAFDAAISLFHVMSYQVSNQDIQETFSAVRRHVAKKGVFVFDCWYGPAVLSDPPAVRVKRWVDGTLKVTRIAEPALHPGQNRVDVSYTILIHDSATGLLTQFNELHQMRYFFKPELEMFASLAGFEIIESLEWMNGNEPGLRSWNACFVARA